MTSKTMTFSEYITKFVIKFVTIFSNDNAKNAVLML